MKPLDCCSIETLDGPSRKVRIGILQIQTVLFLICSCRFLSLCFVLREEKHLETFWKNTAVTVQMDL